MKKLLLASLVMFCACLLNAQSIDILVDGPFIESLADKKLKWVGSSNQNIIDVQARLSLISSIFS